MNKTQLPAEARASFEALKQTNEHGAEYWSARNLQPLLGYSQWRRFEQAIDRAKASCATSGNNPEHHFAGAGKPITGGKGAVQVVEVSARRHQAHRRHLPENIPPAEHIKEVAKRLKGATPKLEQDKRDAGGLLDQDDDAKDAT